MRRGRWPEGQLDRTRLNTSATRARTTIASVEANEWGIGGRGGWGRIRTNDNCFAGQYLELESRLGFLRTCSEVSTLSGCAQEGFDGHIEWSACTAGFGKVQRMWEGG